MHDLFDWKMENFRINEGYLPINVHSKITTQKIEIGNPTRSSSGALNSDRWHIAYLIRPVETKESHRAIMNIHRIDMNRLKRIIIFHCRRNVVSILYDLRCNKKPKKTFAIFIKSTQWCASWWQITWEKKKQREGCVIWLKNKNRQKFCNCFFPFFN